MWGCRRGGWGAGAQLREGGWGQWQLWLWSPASPFPGGDLPTSLFSCKLRGLNGVRTRWHFDQWGGHLGLSRAWCQCP